jgi:hypothetical protein
MLVALPFEMLTGEPRLTPSTLNCTVPVAVSGSQLGSEEVTVAVKVTGTLGTDGLLLDRTVTRVPILVVIVKVCNTLVSTPPFAVPPLSWRRTVTVATPFTFAAGV